MNRCGNNQFQTPLQDVNKDMFYFSSDHRRNSSEMGVWKLDMGKQNYCIPRRISVSLRTTEPTIS